MVRYFVDPILALIKHKEYVVWDGRRYHVDLRDDDEDANPDPKNQYSFIHRGKNMTWANSKEKGRLTLMEMILKDELARLSQYEGKPALSAELEEHKKNYKPNTPWIQHKGGRYYVNLDDANLVPTKSDVASEDEVKKWEEASLEEKKVIVDDVLKVLKRRRQIRECVRKSRDDKKSAKKSAKDTPPVAQTNTTTSNVNDDTPLQLPSQSVREKDVPSEITLNENDPLLIFLRSQESCIKGSVDKFYTWLVTSEDIDTIAALKEAVDEEEYLDIIKVGGGGSSVKGFKMLPFKRAVLAYDNTKAPAAAAASADALTELSRYGGKPAFSAELKLHKEYKLTQNVDTPWIQNGEDDTCYVDLGNTSLVPTKNTTNVASEDEVKKWEEASLEEKKVIVDDVLKTLKIRRQNRFCARKGRAKKNSAKKSANNTPPAEEGSTIVNQFIFGSGSIQGTVVLDSTGRSSEQMRGLDAGVQNESISSSTASSRSDESVASPLLAAAQLSAPQGSTIVMNDITFEANSVRGTVCNGDTKIVQQGREIQED